MKLFKYVFALTLAAAATIAQLEAADFPNGPVTVVVPTGAGSPTDLVARVIAEKLSQDIGVPVVVENKPGGASTVAAGYVSRAEPDGQTLFIAVATTYTTVPFLYEDLSYNIEDFKIAAMLSRFPVAVHIAKRIPASNVKEFVAWAQQQPRPITHGTIGPGSASDVVGALLAKVLGIKMQPIPYASSSAASIDLIAGVIDLQMETINSVLSNSDAGTTKAIGLLAEERWPDAPNLPTFSEQGYPDARFYSFLVLTAPPGTDDAIVGKLTAASEKVMAMPDVQEKFRSFGQVTYFMPPTEAAAYVKAEQEIWGAIIREAGIKLEN